MRVFIMMALIIPALYSLTQNIEWPIVCLITIGCILIQPIVLMSISLMDSAFIRFAFNETIPYMIGYSAIAIPAFKIRFITRQQHLILLIFLFVSIIVVLTIFGIVSPQEFKYPPQSLYILYGLFCSIGLYYIRPFIIRDSFIQNKFIQYLSTNSMWIYLWHIVPVIFIAHKIDYWSLRYIIVLIIFLMLFALYNNIYIQLERFCKRRQHKVL